MIRKFVFYTRVWVTLLAPFVLLLLPADFFDKGESICLSKMIAGVECYACGMTRAIMHFIHFEFKEAWAFNKLSFIVVPLLFPLWLKAVYEVQGKQMPGLLGKLT
ncbi:hypothetical protein CHU92_04295 [Flavobacterium cyanobacteriorum]|uniref:DUF2752 domain-containing protein n=1 Tax=Flavobacterium cyanobacteriorum TaxID=2022802 RepID=A0A255ZJI9_9FLAO|nr:DUF2752 domain-containing protein [Flavobacterium cyanobacteriorum]OYQ41582.1 hypothetical protein CHU92_04295 [Flavobacterium cyanobacteriorum]